MTQNKENECKKFNVSFSRFLQHFGEGGELDGGVRLQEGARDRRVLHEGVEHRRRQAEFRWELIWNLDLNHFPSQI